MTTAFGANKMTTLKVPQWFGLGSVEVPLDEIDEVRDGALVTRAGGTLRVANGSVLEARRLLEVPALEGSLAELGAAFSSRYGSPHAPRRMASRLIDAAQFLGASDLHLEPSDSDATVRLRLAGELVTFCQVPSAATGRLVAALKGLAGCLPYRVDVLQEGRIARAGVGGDVRASFLPTAFGERVALRLFGKLRALGELGFSDEVERQISEALGSAGGGLLLVAGSTGAGKTTTLYAMLAHLSRIRPGAHLSLEDPVEQRLRLAGIAVDQVELEPSRGITAEAVLAASLRQDVDVLCVGEVRTPEECRLALRAAHTGRLVLAGLHAGSASEAVQRMLDLGAESTVLGITLRGVLHQSLSARPCDEHAGARCGPCAGTGKTRRASGTFEVKP